MPKHKNSYLYLKEKAKKARHNFRKVSLKIQKEIDRRFMKQRDSELIIRLKGSKRNIDEIKYNSAERIAKIIGSSRYHLIRSIPYIIVPAPRKDVSRLCSMLNSRRLNAGEKHVRSCSISAGAYTPELALRIGKEMNLLPKIKRSVRRHKRFCKGFEWNLDMVGAYPAHDITKGSGASVLVIDTGVEYTHSQLKHLFGSDKGYNFVEENNKPKDDNGHGTHVCGTVGSFKYGVAPECSVLAAKVLDANGFGLNSDIIRAIDMAINDSRINIATMSLGSSYYSEALEEICREAFRSGVILTAAAGNEYFGAEYPAACSGVISVAAVDSEKQHAEFSNIDSSVDISAPGVNIESTYIGGKTNVLSGTSMATPHIAGISALAVSAKNSIGPKDYEKYLKKNAENIGVGEPNHDEKYGAGLARADILLENIKTMKKVFFGRLRL